MKPSCEIIKGIPRNSGLQPPSILSTQNGGRCRSRTLTTPSGTPMEYMPEFITDEMFKRLCTPKAQHWNALPAELKVYILSFLGATERIKCMLVNKEFSELITEGSLWQTLDASTFSKKIPAANLLLLVQRNAPFIQHLNLRGCSQLRPSNDLRLTNLVSASFEGCRFVTSAYLLRLLETNTKLRHLDISGLSAVNDDTLRALTNSCPLLESIDISYCKNVSEHGIQELLLGSPKLSDVRIRQCSISQRNCQALHGLRRLTRVSLAGCSTLQDSWLKELIYGSLEYGVVYPETRFKCSVEHLDLSRCSGLSAEFYKYLCWVVPDIRKLELNGLSTLSDTGFSELLLTLPELTHIDLGDSTVTDTMLAAVACCDKLRHARLSHCSRITDAGVLALVEPLHLNYLDLDNTQISDRVLSAVAAKQQPMQLSIYDCPALTWTGVLSILTANSARPASLKRVKTFYGWQRPVDGHTKRCIKGDIVGAKEVEKEWAKYMMGSSEKLLRTGEGLTKFLDFDEDCAKIVAREHQKPRACVIM